MLRGFSHAYTISPLQGFFLGAFQHTGIFYVLATIITICTLSFKRTWKPFQKPSQELMWASMGFCENFQLPKMQFPPSLLPPKQVRCNSYDPSLFLRWSYSSWTDLKRTWNGFGTEVQRICIGGSWKSSQNLIEAYIIFGKMVLGWFSRFTSFFKHAEQGESARN